MLHDHLLSFFYSEFCFPGILYSNIPGYFECLNCDCKCILIHIIVIIVLVVLYLMWLQILSVKCCYSQSNLSYNISGIFDILLIHYLCINSAATCNNIAQSRLWTKCTKLLAPDLDPLSYLNNGGKKCSSFI